MIPVAGHIHCLSCHSGLTCVPYVQATAQRITACRVELLQSWVMSEISAIASGPLPIANDAIRKSMARLAGDAHVVATSQAVTSTKTVQAVVDAQKQVLYTKSAARIVSATDKVVNSLLDTRA